MSWLEWASLEWLAPAGQILWAGDPGGGAAKKKPKKKAPAKKARPDVSGLRPAADRDGGQPAPPSLNGTLQ